MANKPAPRKRPVTRTDDRTFAARPEAAAQADINAMMARHSRLPIGSPIGHGNGTRQPMYMDLTVLPESYHQAQNIVIDMRHAFSALPSRVRSRFANDPYQLLRFVELARQEGGKLLDEAIALGLISRPAGSRGDLPPEDKPALKSAQVDLVEEAAKS